MSDEDHRKLAIANFQLPIGGWLWTAKPRLCVSGRLNMRFGSCGSFELCLNCSESRVIGHRLLRSATSAAANYRAACKAGSRADFIFKVGFVEQQADEAVFWLEFLAEAGLVKMDRLTDLIAEGRQWTAILVASRKTAKKNNRQSAIGNRRIKEVTRNG